MTNGSPLNMKLSLRGVEHSGTTWQSRRIVLEADKAQIHIVRFLHWYCECNEIAAQRLRLNELESGSDFNELESGSDFNELESGSDFKLSTPLRFVRNDKCIFTKQSFMDDCSPLQKNEPHSGSYSATRR